MPTHPRGKFSPAGAEKLVAINGGKLNGRSKLAAIEALKRDPDAYTPPEPAEPDPAVKR